MSTPCQHQDRRVRGPCERAGCLVRLSQPSLDRANGGHQHVRGWNDGRYGWLLADRTWCLEHNMEQREPARGCARGHPASRMWYRQSVLRAECIDCFWEDAEKRKDEVELDNGFTL